MKTDLDYFETTARAAVARLPEPFRRLAADVQLRVADWPAPDMLRDLGITDPLELTGLYDGIPVTMKSMEDIAPMPDAVWLFREPILDEWRSRGDVALDDLIAHVVVHEFAHHFGWSDADIARIDPWWE
ncbi:Possibl zinc metallo-peptidase [Pseudoruegeria aquimaris]|uniref:Possibl zinc metallo-peptidase n=1 Tax=Pseudoruegeria aquimaris TaxID=393663 RepID=A0A1Y5RRC2_9RHOB|nr:metallopeptidase family protein [Pseudoruegeria aquimaris]SLN22479.1 Possibl zinc metallo-peptidase [Pseudoruegeria aquimaris]